MKKSCACYAIWNEKIGLWEFLQKSKPNQQEAHLYEEVVILPLANRAELLALYREAMEVARDMAGTFTPIICDDYNKQLDALDARFKKLEAGQ